MRMKRWIFALIPVGILAGGVYEWWPPEADPNRHSDLGAALVAGAVVAFAVLYLEWQFSRGQERRALQLQLGSGKEFPSIDLSGRDMSRFYLPGKDFRAAKLDRTNLRKANLSGVDFSHASLNKADLRGAKLDETPLYPSETLVPSEGLTPSPIFPHARLQNITAEKTQFDSSTNWPPNFDPKAAGAQECTSWWQKLRCWWQRLSCNL